MRTAVRGSGVPCSWFLILFSAVGCTLKVEFRPELSRTWTIPVQYRTKPDARFAVVLQAHMEGIIEFIRFKGESPPDGYNSELPFDWKMAKKIAEARARGEDLVLLKQDEVEKRPPPRRLHYDGGRHGSGRGGNGSNIGAGAHRGHGARGGPPNRAGGYHSNPGAFAPQGGFTPISPRPERRPSFPGPGAPQPWEAQGYVEHGPPPVPMGPPNIPGPPIGVVPYGPHPPAPAAHPLAPPPMPPPPPPHYMHPGFNGYAPPSNSAPYNNPVPPNPVYTNLPPGPMPPAPAYSQPHAGPPTAYPHPQHPHPGYPHPPDAYTNHTSYHGPVPPPPPPGPPQFHGTPHSHPPPFPGPPPQRNAPRPSPVPRGAGKKGSTSNRPSTSHSAPTRRLEQKLQTSRKSTTDGAQSSRLTTRLGSQDLLISFTEDVPVKVEDAPANSSALLSELRRDAQLSKKRLRGPSPPPENVINGKYVTALTGKTLLYSRGRFLTQRAAHCVKTGAKLPVFKHTIAENGKFKVWVIMDRERLELPVTYDDFETGKEKVAKQVLARARGLAKKQKVGGHEEATVSNG